MVRVAKARGLPVTCEVTPHHLVLTDRACLEYDTAAKMYPPLRTAADVEALRAALADGTLDAIATDHAPHGSNQKNCEFDCAAFGMIGLETALPIALSLVREGRLSLMAAIERLTSGPCRVLSLPGGCLKEGAAADLTVVDPEECFVVQADTLESKSKNSPFIGKTMQGRATLTLVGGKMLHDARKVLA
ncbi:hypothetical protein BH09MYX1_BH09MYX1_33030 [soil metagenome]